MVKDGVFQFAISRPCGDEETGRAICLNGMGIRCRDAVLELAHYKKTDAEEVLPIRELRGQERQKIAPLYEQLDAHMRKSPCFFPKPQGISLGGRCKAVSGRGGFDGAGARENVSWRGL